MASERTTGTQKYEQNALIKLYIAYDAQRVEQTRAPTASKMTQTEKTRNLFQKCFFEKKRNEEKNLTNDNKLGYFSNVRADGAWTIYFRNRGTCIVLYRFI